MQGKIDKHFVSNIDKFLEQLRLELPESASQRAERDKYARIHWLRDNAIKLDKMKPTLWEDF